MQILKILVAVFSFAVCESIVASELSVPPQVGDKAPNFRLKTLDGKTVTLTETLKTGPTVVVVLRGFPGYQCPICSRQVRSLIDSASDFATLGTPVVLIYPGVAKQLDSKAREFLKGIKLPGNVTLVTDPDYIFTNAYGLRWKAPLETAYPSTFVIKKDGTVEYALVSRTHGGRAKVKDVLEVLR